MYVKMVQSECAGFEGSRDLYVNGETVKHKNRCSMCWLRDFVPYVPT